MANPSSILKMLVLFVITEGFHVETLEKTWWEADAYCQTKYDTHLITIADSMMNVDIRNAISKPSWIGFYDAQKEGHWKWIGYNRSSFTDWSSSNPSNSGTEDCCTINHESGEWNDVKCSALTTFVCAEPGDYPTSMPSLPPSQNPTLSTTKSPTMNPTTNPTANPTKMPTRSSSPNEMQSIGYGSYCDNLADSSDLIYEINLDECIDLCQHMTESCRMINFYYYFKSKNDSRCYVFDDICEVVSNHNNGVNQTAMYYKTHHESCTDYPHDWVDDIGDNCDAYSTYHWCQNGVIVTNENDFDALTDERYNLTAMDACCDCGGGIRIKNDVAFSVDQYWDHPTNDILCSFTPQPFGETTTSVRQWDNLVLYEFCGYLNEINCTFLVDSQFHSNQYSYSIHLCSGSKATDTQFPFIIDHKVNVESLTHDMYVNLLWFSIDSSYYSTNINIIYSNYSQCVQSIQSDKDINDTYHHGIHPCYTHDTAPPTNDPTIDPTNDPTVDPTNDPSVDPTNDPTIDPTNDPSTDPTTDPTINPTVDPTTANPTTNPNYVVTYWSTRIPLNAPSNDDNAFSFASNGFVFVVILSVLVLCFGVIIVLLLRKSNKQSANQVDEIARKIEAKMREMAQFHNDDRNATDINAMRKPSAPVLAENEYCIICCDNVANMFNDPCGHVTYCNTCADKMEKQEDKCPNCRQIIVQYKQIYQAGFAQN
eukprot:225080_1